MSNNQPLLIVLAATLGCAIPLSQAHAELSLKFSTNLAQIKTYNAATPNQSEKQRTYKTSPLTSPTLTSTKTTTKSLNKAIYNPPIATSKTQSSTYHPIALNAPKPAPSSNSLKDASKGWASSNSDTPAIPNNAPSTIYEYSKLVGMTFEGDDLSGVSFRNAEFQGMIFRNTNLRGANFENATFVNCDLRGAIVDGANFHNATFPKSKLAGVDFSRANMTNANTIGADFKTPARTSTRVSMSNTNNIAL